MNKTQEELNQLKMEIQTMTKKLAELTEEELNEVTAGVKGGFFKVVICDADACDRNPDTCSAKARTGYCAKEEKSN